MKNLKQIFVFTIAIILTSCAASYHSIDPTNTKFTDMTVKQNVDIVYRYDILRDAGNKKYPKKEIKKNIRVVAVKITNNSDTVLNVSKDLDLYCGSNLVQTLSPEDIKSIIRQNSEAYGLYLIGCLTFAPLDMLVFGGIGGGNMLVAGDANKKLYNDLLKFDVRNKVLNKGESVVGIIGFKSNVSDPISVKLRK